MLKDVINIAGLRPGIGHKIERRYGYANGNGDGIKKLSEVAPQPSPQNPQRTGDLVLHGLHAEPEKTSNFLVAHPFDSAQPEDVAALQG